MTGALSKRGTGVCTRVRAHMHMDTQRGHVNVKEEMHARRFQRHGKDMKQVLAPVIRRNSP